MAVHLRVASHREGPTFPGVPVTLELTGQAAEQHIQLASATTGEHGVASLRFSVPEWPDGEYRLHVTAETGRTQKSVTSTIAIKRSWRLMVSADKPVYQPGQVIRIRSLALRKPDLKPVAGEDAVFSVTDSRGNTIFRDRGVTSKFGISSADCALAGEVLEGVYQVECRMGATTGRTTIKVKPTSCPGSKSRSSPTSRTINRVRLSKARCKPGTSSASLSPAAPLRFRFRSLIKNPKRGKPSRFRRTVMARRLSNSDCPITSSAGNTIRETWAG